MKKTNVSNKPVNPFPWTNVVVPEGWINISTETKLRLCQISRQTLPNTAPLVVARSLIVKSDHSWMLHVHGHHADPLHIPGYDITPVFDPTLTTSLLQKVERLNTCIGNPDSKIIDLAKQKKRGQFLSAKSDVVAYLDGGNCVSSEGQEYSCSVRSASCTLLTSNIGCEVCTAYRKTLLTLCLRARASDEGVHKTKKNYRYCVLKLCFFLIHISFL